MHEIFRLHLICISEDLPTASEDCRRFLKTAEDNQRCRKVFEDFKIAAMIFKGFPTNLEPSEEKQLNF